MDKYRYSQGAEKRKPLSILRNLSFQLNRTLINVKLIQN